MEDGTIVKFTTEDGEEVNFKVIEETKLNGCKYLLVLDDIEGEEQEALIMKEVSDKDGEVSYEIVESDTELKSVAKVFEELLEDTELIT
ncbi:MAG: DUF1292 domain-containing protein [Lachnospiraceae bacterium]|jgi:uncharacterized protein YrzB (UPF0473 family)|nr:DUF1292 domain-containing protein [Lachnospiraceae bacterium]